MATIIAPVNRHRSLPPGMSLVELMIAMTIFALILVGIVPMMMSAIAHSRAAHKEMAARTAMNTYIELIKTMPPDSFAIGTTGPYNVGNYTVIRAVTADTLHTKFRIVRLTLRSTLDSALSYERETRIQVQ